MKQGDVYTCNETNERFVISELNVRNFDDNNIYIVIKTYTIGQKTSYIVPIESFEKKFTYVENLYETISCGRGL